jgi:hypothetical protein
MDGRWRRYTHPHNGGYNNNNKYSRSPSRPRYAQPARNFTALHCMYTVQAMRSRARGARNAGKLALAKPSPALHYTAATVALVRGKSPVQV